MKYNITLALALTVALAAQAQNLSTEVKVDRTVVPAERPAERLGSVHPGIVSVPVSARRLDIAEYGGDGTITRSARLLAPAAWGDTFDISRYRGYVSAGYFPAYNAAVSAGYRIIQNATTRLGVWAQFDGYSFKRELPHLLKDRFSNNTFAIGVDFDHRVRNTGVLNLKFATNYGRLEAPTGYSAGKHDIGMTDLSAAWWARAGRVGYHVGASFHRFGFDEDKDNEDQDGDKDTPAITLDQTALTLDSGKTAQLTATGAENIEWTSSDEAVATVDANGKVTAVGAGSATITAASKDATSAACVVTVNAPKKDLVLQSIYGTKNDISIKVGSTAPMEVIGTDSTVQWSMEDSSIATVDSKGNVKGVKSGKTKVIATVDGQTLTCIVRVG